MQMEQNRQLADLNQLSLSMLALAQEKKWSEIEILEKKRLEIMDSFFSHQFTEEDTAFIAPIIQSVISTNQEITEILTHSKKDLQVEFSKFNSSNQAQNAYLKNS